jgi:cobalamin biosynthesis Mg chelatase CobN
MPEVQRVATRTEKRLSVEDFLDRMIEAVNRKFDRQGYLLLKTSDQVHGLVKQSDEFRVEQASRLGAVSDEVEKLNRDITDKHRFQSERTTRVASQVGVLEKRQKITYAAVLIVMFTVFLVGLLLFLGSY